MSNFGDWSVAYDSVLAENCYAYEPDSMEEFIAEAALFAARQGDDLTIRGMLSPGEWFPTASSVHWSNVPAWTDEDDYAPF